MLLTWPYCRAEVAAKQSKLQMRSGRKCSRCFIAILHELCYTCVKTLTYLNAHDMPNDSIFGQIEVVGAPEERGSEITIPLVGRVSTDMSAPAMSHVGLPIKIGGRLSLKFLRILQIWPGKDQSIDMD